MTPQEIGTQILFPAVLGAVMFGLGLSLRLEDFLRVMKFPVAAAVGTFGQILLLPLAAFAVLWIWPMPPLVAGGLVILSACPGGAVSNALVFAAKGDVALSVTLTAVSSVITIFTIPFIVGFGLQTFADMEGQVALDVIDTLTQLGMIILVPMSLGMLIKYVRPNFADRAERVFRVLAIVLVVLMLIAGAFVASGIEVQHVEYAFGAVVALIVVIMPLGYGVSRLAQLDRRRTMTVGIEIGVQNAATGYVIAGTLLKQPDMILTPGVYGIMMFAAAGAAILLAQRSPVH